MNYEFLVSKEIIIICNNIWTCMDVMSRLLFDPAKEVKVSAHRDKFLKLAVFHSLWNRRNH